MRRGRVEEAKSLPHEGGPGGAVGDAVKAPRLDQDAGILEMNMGCGSVHEILKGGERPIPGSLIEDRFFNLLGEVYQCHQADSNLSVFARILDLTLIDVRKEDLKPHAFGFRQITKSGVIPAAVGYDGRHEFCRVVGSQKGGLVGHQGVTGRVGFAEAVSFKAHDHVPHGIDDFRIDAPLLCALNKSAVKVPELLSLVFFAHHFPEGIGFSRRKPR